MNQEYEHRRTNKSFNDIFKKVMILSNIVQLTNHHHVLISIDFLPSHDWKTFKSKKI